MSEITAAQARANAKSSVHGAAEILNGISRSIEATSKTGVTSVTRILSKEAVSEDELREVIATLESRGFVVERIGAIEAHHTIKVSW